MSNPLFKEVNYTLGSLMNYIELGDIGLPDIQRPFVWPNAKVRDLFDSMYRGYPVGYLLLWQNGLEGGQKTIGTNKKQKPPNLLIVDGQQRLTSLYAVIKGIAVVRENYDSEHIEIAFNPLLEKFEVADAAIRKDRSDLPNISKVWSKESDLFSIVGDYLSGLQSTREITPEIDKQVKQALTRLHGMLAFPFTAMELAASLDEEQVSEVFVRVNSKGKPLNQADFILTLMSVFWDEGRTELETFCREARLVPAGKPSPFNHFFTPDPDQLLRVSVGLGFRRARLKHVYSILRGKDLESGEFSNERRDQQFEVLKQAQDRALNLVYWHDFLKALRQSGHCSRQTISSQTAIVYAYTFYLLGRTVYKVDESELRRVIARWFFMTALTGRYSSSPESQMEFDLARLRPVESAVQFVEVLDRLCEENLTPDYWEITLPGELTVASARNPAFLGYCAALVLLDAKVLFSKQWVRDLLDPSLVSVKSAIERHHLFPKAYLKKQGISNVRDTNQVANYALVEWGDNNRIGEMPPSEYLPLMETQFSAPELKRMYYWHALPDEWHMLAYPEFLSKRREMIAHVISDGYATLSPKVRPSVAGHEVDIAAIVEAGESQEVEFKGTLTINLHTGSKDERITFGVLRTIAGFLNSGGGKILVGMLDEGDAIGYKADGFNSEEQAVNYLFDLLTEWIGAGQLKQIHPRFEDYEDVRVLVVECWPAQTPVFLRMDGRNVLYVREAATTVELSDAQAEEYVARRFVRKREPVSMPEPVAGKSDNKAARKDPARFEIRERFWSQLLEKAATKTSLHDGISPSRHNSVGRRINRLWFIYSIREHDGRAELYIDFDQESGEGNERLFDALYARKESIESVFGGSLEWQRLEGKRACRISARIVVGGWRDESAWPVVQDQMISAMDRLEKTMRPHLNELGF